MVIVSKLHLVGADVGNRGHCKCGVTPRQLSSVGGQVATRVLSQIRVESRHGLSRMHHGMQEMQ